MSDAKLPAEGVVVLAWWGDEYGMAGVRAGVWSSAHIWRVLRRPDGWVSLPHAKAAWRLVDAARAVVEQWDTPNWKLVEPTAAKINAMRAVLDEIR